MVMEVDVSNTVLPHDIMHDILLRLPAKSLARFKFVSKSWYKLIRHPCFTNMHLNRSKEHNAHQGKLVIKTADDVLYTIDNFQKFNQVAEIKKPIFRVRDSESRILREKIWGSCNGLLCIQLYRMDDGASSLYIWNPTTTEYREIPPMRKHPLGSSSMAYGFGYVVDDYVILRITCIQLNFLSAVDVYSLRKNSWRTLADIPYSIFLPTLLGVHSNGAFHWSAVTSDDTTRSSGQWYYPLIAYDPISEKCREIPLPDLGTDYWMSSVHEFRGKVCVLYKSNLWVMNEYGVKDSWTKLLLNVEETMSQAQLRYPLCSTECGYIVMKCWGDTITLYLYSPEKKTACPLEVGHNVHKAIYCAETIVAVDINI